MTGSPDVATGMAWKVPFAAVAEENTTLLADLVPRVTRVLTGGVLIGGAEVEEFEHRFARLHGAAHAVGVNSGTDALRLTLQALDLPQGGSGITVANTFIATVASLVAEGLRPRLVDVGEDENMDPAALEAAIDVGTAVVVAVHLRGWPAPIEAIREICRRRGVPLVEDCAQAVGATAGGRPVGTFGVAGCFSLHPLKNLAACGDAGVVVTDDDALAERLRLLRNHGLADRDTVVRWGGNSRLDALQAAILLGKLDHLETWTRRRVELAERYDAGLAGLPLVTPPRGGNSTHVFHRYAIRTPARNELRAYLAQAGIQTAIHYPVPVHRQPAAADSLDLPPGGLPITEQQSAQILSLPLHPALTDEQVQYVTEQARRFWDGAAANSCPRSPTEGIPHD